MYLPKQYTSWASWKNLITMLFPFPSILSCWCYVQPWILRIYCGNTPQSAHCACRHSSNIHPWPSDLYLLTTCLVGIRCVCCYPMLAYLAQKPSFLNCAVVSLHNFEIASAISKLARNLAIDKMRNAISKLQRLPKSVEHIHVCYSLIHNLTGFEAGHWLWSRLTDSWLNWFADPL